MDDIQRRGAVFTLIAAGLPPESVANGITNNCSESVNAVIKRLDVLSTGSSLRLDELLLSLYFLSGTMKRRYGVDVMELEITK